MWVFAEDGGLFRSFHPIQVQQAAEERLGKGQYTTGNRGKRVGREEVISWLVCWWRLTGERNVLNNLFTVSTLLLALWLSFLQRFWGVSLISRNPFEYPCHCTLNKWRFIRKVHHGLEKSTLFISLIHLRYFPKSLRLNK